MLSLVQAYSIAVAILSFYFPLIGMLSDKFAIMNPVLRFLEFKISI